MRTVTLEIVRLRVTDSTEPRRTVDTTGECIEDEPSSVRAKPVLAKCGAQVVSLEERRRRVR